MTRKFLLVPHDAYQGLLRAQPSLQEHSEEQVSRTLHNKKLGVSKRNALYNQRLTGMLKQKRAAEKKPVRVTFGDEQVALPAASATDAAASEKSRRTTLVDDDTLNVSGPLFNSTALPVATDVSSLSRATTVNKSLASPDAASTPNRPMNRSGLADMLLDTINARAVEFGVDAKGHIMTAAHQPIAHSNMQNAISYYVNGQQGNAPAGAKALHERIMADAMTAPIMTNIQHLYSPAAAARKGGVRRKPTTTTKAATLRATPSSNRRAKRLNINSWGV